jgi:hypothetical protein
MTQTPPRCVELSVPGSGNNGTVRTLVTDCSVRSGDVYRRYVSGLYRQALLTRGDSALAVRVVSDVIGLSTRLRRRGGAAKATYATAWQSRYSSAASSWPPARRDGRPVPRLPGSSSAAVAETAEEQEKGDAETRIRHGGHRGSCRSRARSDGGQVAAGCAAVHGDEEDVTRAASRSPPASRSRATVRIAMSGPRGVNGTPMPG